MHGRLPKFIPFWQETGASKWVVNILKGGYHLPFVSDHHGKKKKKKKKQGSCNSHGSFVDEAVKSLVECGSATEVDRHELECVSPLAVMKGATKLRLILDLRQVNKCLKEFRFKLEDIRTAVKLFHKGDLCHYI